MKFTLNSASISITSITVVFTVALTLIIYVSKVDSESMLVTQTAPTSPQNETDTVAVSPSLEDKIDNLTFNLRHMEEVLIQWRKNFKMIDRRFQELEKKVQELSSSPHDENTTRNHSA